MKNHAVLLLLSINLLQHVSSARLGSELQRSDLEKQQHSFWRSLQQTLKVFKASPDLLAANIGGDGFNITSTSLKGKNVQAGLFTGGFDIFGLSAGAILSTGRVDDAEGVNDGMYPSSNFGEPGYTPLENLTGNKTFDAAVLTINFACEKTGSFSFKYVFGSEDYSATNKGFAYEDVMGAFLNGLSPSNNIATVNASYVSVKTINCSPGNELCPYYVPNQNATTEMNGYTVVLEAQGVAQAGSNVLNIAIADGIDGNYPSWVLIGQDSMTCIPAATPRPVPPPPPRTTRIGVCYQKLKGCPCGNFARLKSCVSGRAQKSCTLPSGGTKTTYIKQLVTKYKKFGCK